MLPGRGILAGGTTLAGGVILAGGRTLAGRVILVGGLMLAGGAGLDAHQNSPRVAMLEQDGWAAIQGGDAARAAESFSQATMLDPKNAALWFGAGVAEFLQRHDPEAKARLEQALVLDPKLTSARAQLAQVVKRQGDLLEAIRLYEIVAGEAPDDPGVLDTLARWKRERDLHDRMAWAAVASADPLTCIATGYKATAGLVAAVADNAVTVTWDGEKNQEIRLRFTVNGGTPTIADLSVRAKGGT